jgi:NADH:ubiquinone oxidoreductase subunit E
MLVQICVGSACCLNGSHEIVEICQKLVAEHHLETEIALAGSFCTGKCNRVGVTILVDDKPYTGITPESFPAFFQDKILNELTA